MADWTSPMQQTFEYYTVDPGTWKDVKLLENITGSSISRDMESETLGSATIDMTDTIGEVYIRIYLVTVQNGIRERHSLGTFLAQTPSVKFDGMVSTSSVDAYTPLIELKENQPPLGYFIEEDENIMEWASRLTKEHARAPVVAATSTEKLYRDFVSETDDTWMSFLIDLLANADFYFELDEMGRILFAPKQDTASLQPVWTYTDDNSSILYPELTLDHDIYGVPNVVEVVYSDSKDQFYARVVNDDENSPTSTISRGREIVHRVQNPEFPGAPNQAMIDEYADKLLKDLSTLEYTISYQHGYNGVRLGDCVRLDYKRAGMRDIKARVISQSIKCEQGCPVDETAVFTKKLWR